MDLVKTTIRKSSVILLLLAVISAFIDWNRTDLKFIGLFGNPNLFPQSLIIGGLLGLANLKGLSWGLNSLLGSYKANTRLVFLSLIRLFAVLGIIVMLAFFRLINLLGLLAGMSVVFVVLITEAMKSARRQE